jgi:TonB family protein
MISTAFTYRTRRTLALTVIGIIVIASTSNGQHVRIGNAGVIPNGGMAPPTILKSTVAPYTDAARNKGVEGTVTLEAQVDINGRTKVLRVIKGLGFGLDEVARSAVGEWIISPATRNGLPVEVISQTSKVDRVFECETPFACCLRHCCFDRRRHGLCAAGAADKAT